MYRLSKDEEDTDDPGTFVAAARRRASKQRENNAASGGRTCDLVAEDQSTSPVPNNEHLEALARLRDIHAPVMSPVRGLKPTKTSRKPKSCQQAEVDKARSPVVANELESTMATGEGSVESNRGHGKRRTAEVKLTTYAEYVAVCEPHLGWRKFGGLGRGRIDHDEELIRKLARQAKVRHFSKQLRQINAERGTMSKASRSRKGDRVNNDARSRGLEFYRRHKERELAASRDPRPKNAESSKSFRQVRSNTSAPEGDAAVAHRAALEEMLQRHDAYCAEVEAFR